MDRCDWTDLPEAVRREVGRRCGPIGQVSPVAAGMNNAAAGVLDTDGGAVFYKGIRAGDPRVWMYRNEAAAARAGVPGPGLRWVVEADEWVLLGWEYVEGRHASLVPGSPDLAHIAKALHDLAARSPLAGRDTFASESRRWEQMRPWARLAVKPPEQLDQWVSANLDRFAGQEAAALDALAGDHLAHTDLHELNLLIDERQAKLIDWAWARRAAPWVDAEMLTLRLVAAGHPCEEADRWRLAHLPHPDLEPEVRRMFAVEMLGVWAYLAMRKPGRALFAQMSDHALKWARHLQQVE
ncbi:phosphotransferase [Glycomyces buryatensis]|uniref:Aminoglycoside phosphotransferase domain-containing protein n=1 Tax=Glycomyces buryatensis TaxID=2570927 RepID=A0A4S8Q4X4_9ACTN|nr:phosphotransferase [Glycomyces buryatensis]THV35689.1 hypothetical protein FAB82_22705 [Glycomyces buryatensis]